MTSPEAYTALFWMVAGGYVIYLGWTLYRIVAQRSARARHPSHRGGSPRRTAETAPERANLERLTTRTRAN